MGKFSEDVFDIREGGLWERRRRRRISERLLRESRRSMQKTQRIDDGEGFPENAWKNGGENRPRSGRGTRILSATGVNIGGHTASTACPFLSGPSLGANGVMIGSDAHGGGPFSFDPWEAYRLGYITGMSMLVFGTVGTGKSSLVKSFAIRVVLAGRKLAVASDLKGEWTGIIKALRGQVIQIGPGLGTKLNPLDPGVRPSRNRLGKPMTDDAWAMVVRTRRLQTMTTLAMILMDSSHLSPAEHASLEIAVDEAVAAASREDRTPTVVDVIDGLQHVDEEELESAARLLGLTLRRITTGAMAGMFDGESTADFSGDVPAVSIDTSAMRGASKESRRIVSACCGAWMEAMITHSDGGQRVVVYEEGWDSLASYADLSRMVEQWKLARDYGIFNILILHKLKDLDMAGDQGSAMAAMAQSLLADADVKVIYRQDSSSLRQTSDRLELNDREIALLRSLRKGRGLWKVGQLSFEVDNELTVEEVPLLDTDQRMDVGRDYEDYEGMKADEKGAPLPEWLAA